jgi:hypothetical protein
LCHFKFSSLKAINFYLPAAYRHPAIDHDLGARHKPRFIRSQEDGSISRITPVSHEGQGDARLTLLK